MAAETQDVAAQASGTTRHVVHHRPSIDWCPWIDALGSVWDDIKKDTSKCPPDGGG